MNHSLQKLIDISTTVGKNKALVLGNYGNTSVKTDDGQYMYVKASGAELAKMNPTTGWRKVHLQKILEILNDRSLLNLSSEKQKKNIDIALLKACCDKKPASIMPSIETFFHALLGPVVVHLHPESILAIACAKEGQKQAAKLFDTEKYPPLWLPYTGLGYVCAKKIQQLAQRYEKEYSRNPAIIIMQNHGLLISANSNLSALRIINKVIKTSSKTLKTPKSIKIKPINPLLVQSVALHIRSAIYKAAGRNIAVHHYNNPTISAFLKRTDAKQLCTPAALTPDESAVTSGGPLWIQKADETSIRKLVQKRINQGKPTPIGYAVKDMGLFIAATDRQADYLAEFFCSYMKVRAATTKSGGPRPIPTKLAAQFAEPAAIA